MRQGAVQNFQVLQAFAALNKHVCGVLTQTQQSFIRNTDARVVAQWNIFLHHLLIYEFCLIKIFNYHKQ